MTKPIALLFFALNIFSSNLLALDLKTHAEKTDYRETGRYSEVGELCHAFAKSYPKKVKCLSFGTTPEGRAMWVLVVSGRGWLTPAANKQQPVMLFQGGIHSGEIDGKDAGFWFLRSLLEKDSEHLLDKVTFVFVPVFNIDGHERFTKNNRPNQNGPESMGWRTTAQNLNLNRDYMKADAPEMVAMLKLLREWNPIVYLDLHVTDGAQFQHDIAVMIAPTLRGHDGLRDPAVKLQDEVMAGLSKRGHLPVPFYPSFVKDDEPESGFEYGIAPPRFSQQYWALRHRIGILVETHSWKDYATRVRATKATLELVAGAAAKDGKHWLEISQQCGEDDLKLGGKEAVLSYEPGKEKKNYEFKGYRFERKKSVVTGTEIIRYDARAPESWKVPLFTELVPHLKVIAPKEGYIVPPAFREIVEPKLRVHGVEYRVLKKSIQGVEVERFQSKDFEFGKKSYEGRQTLKVKGEWRTVRDNLAMGSLFIPISQPLAELSMQLLEPMAPDSLVSWGFFNGHFEVKEYIESYVLVPWAEAELASNASLRSQFEQKLKEDKTFAADPEKRLDFFYERHPSHDERLGRYPILRLQQKISEK